MSKFIVNESCEMCHKIETGLTKMTVGKTEHHLCYNCLTVFIFDAVEYASFNLTREFETEGYTINGNYDGFVIKRKSRNLHSPL